MKRLSIFAVVMMAFIAGLSSCVRHDDYYVQPNQYDYVFSDNFDNDANKWSFSDNGNNAFVYVSNGMLHYDYHPAKPGTNTVAVSVGMPTNTKVFDIQTRFQSDNAMAMVFGVSQSDYGYSFFIDDKGNFALYDEGTSSINPVAILNWTKSSAVRQGWNDLELQGTQNGNWIGYINGTEVFQTSAHTLYGNQVGFMVLDNTSGDADYLDVKW